MAVRQVSRAGGNSTNLRLAADIGGTFTDIAVFDDKTGYLKSVLDLLNVPVESQMLVFSQTSVQGDDINYLNPRALFFNDSVAIGWVRGTTVLEAMALERCRQFVFSSTAAVYALDGAMPLTEEAATRPSTPYGQAKLAVEQALPHVGHLERAG